MSRPRPGRPLWIAARTAVALAAALAVVWSVTRPESPTTTRLPSTAPSPPSTTVDALAEPRARTPQAPPVPARRLVLAAEKAAQKAADPGMILGVAVTDLHTGAHAVGGDGDRPFMAASLTKLIVAVDVLDQLRAEGRQLTEDDRDLIHRALSAGDDNAMNVLWGKHDGAGAIARTAARLELSATLPPESTEMWGDVEVTAADMAKVFGHVLRDMPPDDGAVIVEALSAATSVATDGFAQHYGVLHQGASPRSYAKQAWVPYAPAGYLLHSAGVVYDGRTGHAYAIALLSIQPYTSEQAARDRLSDIAAAATADLDR
ncbi:serine hydrolase [Actinophytocola sp. NPDC049390]|uniref:serine hydrolase n=1 Tax=Actinophytocola sp. NPDC049390 TaxID=3363894 RepID=UPI0037B16A41